MTKIKRIRATTIIPLIVVLALVSAVLDWNCKYPNAPAHGNSPPGTRLANVPPNDTIAQYLRLGVVPEVQLNWIGDDPDGYVVGYKFRWSDIYHDQVVHQEPWTTVLTITFLGASPLERPILVVGQPQSVFNIYHFITTLDIAKDTAIVRILGDSLETQRPFAVPYRTGIVPGDSIAGADTVKNITPTIGKFIFDSPTDSNQHLFEVASIDNNDAEDPTPAIVNFWTLPAPAPIAIINTFPSDSGTVAADTQYVLRYPNELNPGLTFAFSSLDPSTDEREYSWGIDDTTTWSPWQVEGTTHITAQLFKPVRSGRHRFYLRARNRWGVVSAVVDTPFYAKIPPFDTVGYQPRTLIINNDLNGVNGIGVIGRPDSNQVKAYYSQILGELGKSFDIWTIASQGNTGDFPPLSLVLNYSTVFLVSEQPLPAIGLDAARHRITSAKGNVIFRFTRLGGNFIFSCGPSVRKLFGETGRFFGDGQNIGILHTVPVISQVPTLRDPLLDFIGGKGQAGYPNVRLDSTKIQPDSMGALRNMEINIPLGFGQAIYNFDSKLNNQYENLPIGIRYLAPAPTPPARQTYSTVFFGFPLYYAYYDEAKAAVQKAYEDINEYSPSR